MSSPYRKKKAKYYEKALVREFSLGYTKSTNRSVQHLENAEQIMYQVGHHIDIFNYVRGTHKIIPKGEKVKKIHGFLLSKGKKYLAVSEEKSKSRNNDQYQVTLYNHGMDMKYKSLKVDTETPIRLMTFSRNNEYLVGCTGTPENIVIVWDLEKFKMVAKKSFKRDVIEVRFCEFVSPDFHSTLSVLHETCLRVFYVVENELKPADPIFPSSSQQNFTCHVWYDVDKMLVATKGGNVVIVEGDYVTKRIRNVFLASGAGIYAISLVERGFICAGDNGYFTFFERSYDKNYFNQYKLFQSYYNVRIDNICVSVGEDNVICSCVDNTILNLNFSNIDIVKENEENFERLPVEFHSEVVLDVSVSIQKSLVATVSKNTIRIWNYELKEVELRKRIPTPPHNGISSVSIHPNGTEILLSFNEKIVLYKILNRDLYDCYDWHVRACSCVKHSSGGHYFAASYGTRIMVVSTLTYNKVVELEGHDGIVRGIVWSRHDQIISSCGDDGTVFVWKVHKKIVRKGVKTKTRQNHTRVSKVIVGDSDSAVKAISSKDDKKKGKKKEGDDNVNGEEDGSKTQEDDEMEGEGEDEDELETDRFRNRSTQHILETNQVENCELNHVVHERATGSSAAIGSDMFLWCFTSKAVVQIDPRGNSFSTMVLSTLTRTLFIGTNDGKILLYEWPLSNQHYKEYHIHSGRIVRLVLDIEERFLFSVGEDGSLFKFAITFKAQMNTPRKKKKKKGGQKLQLGLRKQSRSRRCSTCSSCRSSVGSLESSRRSSRSGIGSCKHHHHHHQNNESSQNKNNKGDEGDNVLESQVRKWMIGRDKKWDNLESVTFIMKNRIEEMKSNIVNLKEKMKQVEKDARRQIDEEQEEKRQTLGEITSKQKKEIDALKNQLSEQKQRTEEKKKEARRFMKKIEKEHSVIITDFEGDFQKQEVMEEDRYEDMQVSHENIVANYEDEIRKLKNQHRHQLHQVTEDNLGEKVIRLRGFHKIEKEFWNVINEFKTKKKKESEDYVWEIDVERYKYENEIERLKKEKKELEESQKNHKQDFDRILEKVKARDERIIAMTKELQERTDNSGKLQKKLEMIMKQIHDRQDQIDASSDKIDDQRKELTELEKLRFLLTFKYDRLKDEVQPVLENISQLDEKLMGMTNELNFLKGRKEIMKDTIKKNTDKEKVLRENVRKLKNQFSHQSKIFNFLCDELFDLLNRTIETRQNHDERRRNWEETNDYTSPVRKILPDSPSSQERHQQKKAKKKVGKPFINGARRTLDPEERTKKTRESNKDKKISLQLQIQLQNVIEKYNSTILQQQQSSKDKSSTDFMMKKNAQLLEFERERDYLEQKMQSLQKTLQKKDQNYVSDVHRKTSENSVLVKEINILRQDINNLERNISKEQEVIGKQNNLIFRFQKVLMSHMNGTAKGDGISKNVYLPLLDDLKEKFHVNNPRRNREKRKSKTIGRPVRRRRRGRGRKIGGRTIEGGARKESSSKLTSIMGRNRNRFDFGEVPKKKKGRKNLFKSEYNNYGIDEGESTTKGKYKL